MRRVASPSRGRTTIRSSAGSRPWCRRCESTAYRSDGNVGASIRIAAATPLGAIEAGEQQMQVDGQGVRGRDLVRPSADDAGRHLPDGAVGLEPAVAWSEPGLDTELAPSDRARASTASRAVDRLGAERHPREIRLRPPAGAGRQEESLAPAGQRIGGVEGPGAGLTKRGLERGHRVGVGAAPRPGAPSDAAMSGAPPTDTRRTSKPAASSMLAAIDAREPLLHMTVIGASRGNVSSRSARSPIDSCDRARDDTVVAPLVRVANVEQVGPRPVREFVCRQPPLTPPDMRPPSRRHPPRP